MQYIYILTYILSHTCISEALKAVQDWTGLGNTQAFLMSSLHTKPGQGLRTSHHSHGSVLARIILSLLSATPPTPTHQLSPLSRHNPAAFGAKPTYLGLSGENLSEDPPQQIRKRQLEGTRTRRYDDCLALEAIDAPNA